jgi:hypothetical protein
MVKQLRLHVCPENTMMGRYLSQNCGERPDSKPLPAGTDIGMKPQGC